MKRFIILLVLMCCFCATAHAHSGRTDSNGGHTDHATGDYHYHHGYSAHDHYDIDGDGIVDCPMTFKPSGGNEKEKNNGKALGVLAVVGTGGTAYYLHRKKNK